MIRFRPGLWPTLMVLALLTGLVSLGCWQLGRAEQKRVLLARYAEQQLEAPVEVAQVRERRDPAFVSVQLQGRLDAAHSVLLDNRTRDGQAGVELLQPLQDQASGLWLWVNRGWLPWPDRRMPVTFDTPAGVITLTASVYVAPGAVFQLRPDAPGKQWPQVLTAIDPPGLWRQLQRTGYPFEVRMQSGPGSYRLGWPQVTMGPERHLGYAMQWFALAAALTLLYLYFGWHHARELGHAQRLARRS